MGVQCLAEAAPKEVAKQTVKSKADGSEACTFSKTLLVKNKTGKSQSSEASQHRGSLLIKSDTKRDLDKTMIESGLSCKILK